MKENNTNKLMNTLMYDALRNAGVKKADARAAAIEAGRNDLRLITFEYAINQARTEQRSEMSQLKAEVKALMAEESKKVIHTLLIAIGVATAILSVVISFN